MDLTALQTLANAISPASPAIKKYAVEQVRVSKAQEARLLRLEAKLAARGFVYGRTV